jgi:hypothetical protein
VRKYLLFGSDDGETWHLLGEEMAGGSGQALNLARNYPYEYTLYAVVPARNWTAREPQVVERAPVVKWNEMPKDQMTVDEVLKEAEKEGVQTAPAPKDKDFDLGPEEPAARTIG